MSVDGSLEGALRGIRILDLSRLLPGPFASLALADLGAQVDKVEEMGGDYLRHMAPFFASTEPAVADMSAMFAALNRGKRSIALDLKKPRAREVILRLVACYDVVLEQFRPGVLERLGLSHATLRANSPRLVLCALTGYGQTGPLAQRAGHDIDYLARAGVLGMQGPAGEPPTVPGFQLADVGGGLWAIVGILAALAQRERTGQGTVVDVAMVEASMGFAIAGLGALFAGAQLTRGEEALTGGLAGYAIYATKDDKHVALGALEPKFLMAFCQGVGEPFDPTALVPGAHQRDVRARFTAIFRTRTRDEWTAFGEAHDCCLEPVLAPDELADDPHLTARRAFFTLDSRWGPLRQLRLPVTNADAVHHAPPALGEHTDAILGDAGFDAAAIASLKAEGAVR